MSLKTIIAANTAMKKILFFNALILFGLMACDPNKTSPEKPITTMNASIVKYIDSQVIPGFDTLSPERKEILNELSDWISENTDSTRALTFICTHNSRRSHFGQIWAQVAANYYGISNIKTYSGGTEATAFNPRAIAAMERVGFSVAKDSGENPMVHLKYDTESEAINCFSKKYNDKSNPQKQFAAIMTCSQADEACPVVFGASKRFAIMYLDPKVADNTDQETAKYDERCKQIATEMFYVMSRVKK